MSAYDYSVLLRIRHPSIDPEQLSRRLGLSPQHAWRAGEQRQPDDGEPTAGVYRESCWAGFLPPERILGYLGTGEPNAPLAAAEAALTEPMTLIYLTAMKMKRAPIFWQELVEGGGTIEFLVQIESGEPYGLDLSRAALAALVEVGATLSIEVGPPHANAAAA